MITRILALAPLAMLAACTPSKDFTVEVAASSSSVLGQLAALDGSLLKTAGLEPFRLVKDTDPGTLHFVIPAKDGYGDGELFFYVTGEGSKSRIDVAMDLPQIRYGNMELKDDKAEAILQRELESWAAKGGGSMGNVETLLIGLALATQDIDAARNGTLATRMAMNSLMLPESGGGWADDGGIPESYEAQPEFGKPMNSTGSSGSASYSDYDEYEAGADVGGGWGDGSQ